MEILGNCSNLLFMTGTFNEALQTLRKLASIRMKLHSAKSYTVASEWCYHLLFYSVTLMRGQFKKKK